MRDHNGLYSRGEFANKFGTTVFTLRLYDRIGILKPAYTNDKGYHFYSDEQSRELLAINMCIRAGMSLTEIKDLQKDIEEVEFDQLALTLEDIRNRIHRERVQLESNELMIENMIQYGKLWEKRAKLGCPFMLSDILHNGFLSEPSDYLHAASDSFEVSRFIQSIERELGHPIEWPISYRIPITDCGTPEFASTRIFLRTRETKEGSPGFIHEHNQTLLAVACEGDYEAVRHEVARMCDEALSRNMKIVGPALVTRVQNYLFGGEKKAFVAVIGIPVKEA